MGLLSEILGKKGRTVEERAMYRQAFEAEKMKAADRSHKARLEAIREQARKDASSTPGQRFL